MLPRYLNRKQQLHIVQVNFTDLNRTSSVFCVLIFDLKKSSHFLRVLMFTNYLIFFYILAPYKTLKLYVREIDQT